MDPLVRPLTAADRDAAIGVINAAAAWYREFLPAEEVHGPEMTPAAWDAESARMTWHGAFIGEHLVGVLGLEYVRDVALMRHAYVLPEHQRQAVASRLMDVVETSVTGVRRIIAGTYVKNRKARRFLAKRGFVQSVDSAAILRTYYAIPEARLISSVTYEKAI